MAKKKDVKDFHYEIEEIIGVLKEYSKHDWAKGVFRISWNDRPSTIDIRTFNFSTNRPGTGIALSDEETESLVNLLLEKDYGSVEALEQTLKRKKSRYVSNTEIEQMFEPEQQYYNIEFRE
jgi:hypothetical protein